MTNYNLHRQILSQTDLDQFLSSESFTKIESFLLKLNESVKGRERLDNTNTKSDSESESGLINWALGLIQVAEDLVNEYPPQGRNADVNRFGNVAFREWLFALQDKTIPEQFLKSPLPTGTDEIEGYFVNSLGSSQRIDYGTGHELHFLLFLMGLSESLEIDEYPDLVLKVFSAYVRLMRRLQKTYWLEPAGSHGVWGLDDYHFLPFLFGSAQLCGHANLRPKAVHSAEMVHYLAPKYIYFDSILNILEIKSAAEPSTFEMDIIDIGASTLTKRSSLRWMSPVLDDISAVKTWEKVNLGLFKMWRVEVMSKLPIMQHLLFGNTILTFKRSEIELEYQSVNSPVDPHYTHSAQGDCCGNPLPSIYAATGKSLKQPPGLPFD